MNTLQLIFTNREIAIGTWVLLIVIILLFTKPAHQSLKTVIPIILSKKFIVFYIVFIGFFGLTIYGLYLIGFWKVDLLKDTIFWVLFIEIPLFVKTIDKAKDNHFFIKLIKDNIALIVIFEFLLGFWTFGIVMEFIIFPITLFGALVYAISEHKKKYHKVQSFFIGLLFIWIIIIIINFTINIIKTPEQLFNLATLRTLSLPIILLFLNLPVVYGLALFNTYEQLFLHVKGDMIEKPKMKRRIFLFAWLSLSKTSAIRNNMSETLVISLNEKELSQNLTRLNRKLSMQIGENYMKRSKFYILWCAIGLVVSIIGIVFSNTELPVKDIVSFNFSFSMTSIKEIISYASITAFILCIFCLFFSIGLARKKNEEISQIKIFALHELLYLVEKQQSIYQKQPPSDNLTEFFSLYVINAYEIKGVTEKAIAQYENLLTRWEREAVNQLELKASSLIRDIGIKEEIISQYDTDSFLQQFNENKDTSQQNNKINIYTHTIQKDTEKYLEQIKLCYDVFKHYIQK